jgi:hypothetical protein
MGNNFQAFKICHQLSIINAVLQAWPARLAGAAGAGKPLGAGLKLKPSSYHIAKAPFCTKASSISPPS